MIKAVIFDMDGLLIDSEPFWQEEERNVFKERGLVLTPDMQKYTHGLGTNEVIEYWYHYQPWKGFDPENIRRQLYERVEKRVRDLVKPRKGALRTIDFFTNQKVKLGLASASPLKIINAVLESLELQNVFDTIHSCELEQYGKPHPAVYISTAEKLRVNALQCLVFEDSYLGLLAAKAARMKTVVIPDPEDYDNLKYIIADCKLPSLLDFGEEQFAELSNNQY